MAVSGTGQGETPQSLAAPAFAGFHPVAENGTKAALTTGLTTDRKIFDFLSRRGIMAEIEYPGIAKLVSRLVWDQEVAGSNPVTPILTNMREWLSWWSATLPRSRPRVRVPSRALAMKIAYAAVAQSVERRIGSAEVTGPIPVSSSSLKSMILKVIGF